MPNQVNDPILKQAMSGVEQKVPPELRQGYDAIMGAAMELMFSKTTNKYLLEGLGDGKMLEKRVADMVAGGLMYLYNESKRTMSIDAAMIAIVPIVCNILEFAEGALDIKITPEMLAKITLESTRETVKRFGMDKQQPLQQGQQPQSPSSSPLIGAMPQGGM